MGHSRPAKRRRVASPTDDDRPSHTIRASDLLGHAASWDLEDIYAQRRKRRTTKDTVRLPIKTTEGRVEESRLQQVSEDESDSFLDSGDDGEVEDDDTPPTDDTDEQPPIPVKQQILQAKEEIARLAGLLNEDPEEHAGSFKKLAQVAGPQAHISVQKLVLASQAAVYKDIIPGYRIRAYSEDDMSNKVSKDIRRTRQYEHALITGYQTYIKTLTALTRKGSKENDPSELKTTALGCACTLLMSVPHFNFRTELLGILVHELATRDPTPDFVKSISTLESFFQDDVDGAPSLEAVNLLAKMLKARNYRIREEVLNTFLHLRLLTELNIKASTTHAMNDSDAKLHGRKVKKEKQQHMSKKQRKIARESKAVEKDMREARAEVDYEARDKMQSETLKVVFVIYFRILKARTPELMGATLEGLARFAHLINQDFFGDILEALKDIIHRAETVLSGDVGDDVDPDEAPHDGQLEMTGVRHRVRECLLATQTAFTLLSKQEVSKSASSLSLDLSYFTNHVYRMLYPLGVDANLELGPKSLHLLDPHMSASQQVHKPPARHKINIHTPILLLTRALTSILLSSTQQSASSATPLTTVAFLKRVLTVLTQTPEKSSIALLSLFQSVVSKHGKRVEALWYSDERKGDGVYRADAESIDGTRVWSVGSGVWEGELLRKHYAPDVRQAWATIEKDIAALGT